MPSGEEIHQELKPSPRMLLKAGPCRPHEPEYNHAPFPNIIDIIQNDTSHAR